VDLENEAIIEKPAAGEEKKDQQDQEEQHSEDKHPVLLN